MKFARRLSKIKISGIRRAFESAGKDFINLGLGEPDFDTPAHILNAAERALREGYTKYTYNKGLPELREAISDKLKRENGVEVSPECVIATAGASEALHISLLALVERGSEVLIPDPGFVSFSALVRLAEAKPVGVKLREEDMTMSVEDVQEKISARTKAIIVNSPSNPTGAVQSEEDMRALAEIAQDKNIFLISDEVYEHFIYEGKHVSPARFAENVVIVNSVSKTYAMTGFRLGFVAVKNEEYVEQMLKIHQYIQACAPAVSQIAALAALKGPQDSVAKMREEFKHRRDFVVEALQQLKDGSGKGKEEAGCGIVSFTVPKGAFYIFPKVQNEEKFVEHAFRRGVILTPGSTFGEGGRNHVRISFAARIEKLKDAFERLKS